MATARVVDRRYAVVLRGLLRRFPFVTVLGPRQCGKTTFIRQALPHWHGVTALPAQPLLADPERVARL